LTTADRTSDRHPAQWLALVIGAVYTLVGVVGFFVTGFDGFAEPSGELLLGVFEINRCTTSSTSSSASPDW
jgi:hypothetical protein